MNIPLETTHDARIDDNDGECEEQQCSKWNVIAVFDGRPLDAETERIVRESLNLEVLDRLKS